MNSLCICELRHHLADVTDPPKPRYQEFANAGDRCGPFARSGLLQSRPFVTVTGFSTTTNETEFRLMFPETRNPAF